jgi:glucose/mannose-6-phosphate isomerase
VYLLHFGDWVSLYLAVENQVDPTPVAVIDFLKGELAKQ